MKIVQQQTWKAAISKVRSEKWSKIALFPLEDSSSLGDVDEGDGS